MTFNAGDRVQVTAEGMAFSNGHTLEEEGTVLGTNPHMGTYTMVRWDNHSDDRHTCADRCTAGHGWNFLHQHLQLSVKKPKEKTGFGKFLKEHNL